MGGLQESCCEAPFVNYFQQRNRYSDAACDTRFRSTQRRKTFGKLPVRLPLLVRSWLTFETALLGYQIFASLDPNQGPNHKLAASKHSRTRPLPASSCITFSTRSLTLYGVTSEENSESVAAHQESPFRDALRRTRLSEKDRSRRFSRLDSRLARVSTAQCPSFS
jgi:hypothetical protein